MPVHVLFVGINPGIRSAAIGHHFAGYSNRFWRLLCESGLVPERIGTEDDARLPEWGYGVTNLIPRATPGIDTLRPEEYVAGIRVLRRKIRRWRPQGVAFGPDGSLHVVDALAGACGVYRVANGGSTPDLVVSAASLVGVAFGPSGEMAVTSNETAYRFE